MAHGPVKRSAAVMGGFIIGCGLAYDHWGICQNMAARDKGQSHTREEGIERGGNIDHSPSRTLVTIG
jgi:hypothetical protein